MRGATTTDRPFLISGESGRNEASAADAVREFTDRPPRVPPPPDNLWFIRPADDLPSPHTQPRSGESQSADGGTIFFEEAGDFAAQFHSDAHLSLNTFDDSLYQEPESDQRVVLWMREGDSTLRSLTIDQSRQASSTNPRPDRIESAEEILDCPLPLEVWTLWTNPRRG